MRKRGFLKPEFWIIVFGVSALILAQAFFLDLWDKEGLPIWYWLSSLVCAIPMIVIGLTMLLFPRRLFRWYRQRTGGFARWTEEEGISRFVVIGIGLVVGGGVLVWGVVHGVTP
jgi:hypothetical protein